MNAIDFANSYMTWFPQEKQGNIARIQLDAACTLIDEASGKQEIFYLIAPCRSERMYLDTPLFQLPNYEFCGIWSADEFLIIRTAWVSARDNRQYGKGRERWQDIHLDIRTFAHTEVLTDDEAIVKATLDNRPLNARTELYDAATGRRALLEYPIKTMNVMVEPMRFQVDTGPLILPDFTATTATPIESFEMAHVVYNGLDKAEFVLRKPIAGAGGDADAITTDYAAIQIMAARNEILASFRL
ncbi:MAG: hypothetical protein KF832_05710 [Caldilineaceae bacterium]|nr:hypothetical protein [Caldilineaceae bacterium]